MPGPRIEWIDGVINGLVRLEREADALAALVEDAYGLARADDRTWDAWRAARARLAIEGAAARPGAAAGSVRSAFLRYAGGVGPMDPAELRRAERTYLAGAAAVLLLIDRLPALDGDTLQALALDPAWQTIGQWADEITAYADQGGS